MASQSNSATAILKNCWLRQTLSKPGNVTPLPASVRYWAPRAYGWGHRAAGYLDRRLPQEVGSEMIRILNEWQERRRYRALSNQLAVLNGELLRDVGVRFDDVETLRRGKNPWRD